MAAAEGAATASISALSLRRRQSSNAVNNQRRVCDIQQWSLLAISVHYELQVEYWATALQAGWRTHWSL